MGWRCTYARTGSYGFSLIELTIVLLIVTILAAVLVPHLRPPRDRAIWSEGYAGAGALATGIRIYSVATCEGHPAIPPGGDFSDFQVYEVDLRGKYFQPANYSVSEVTYDEDTGAIRYVITVTAPEGVSGGGKTLDHDGEWRELSADGGGT